MNGSNRVVKSAAKSEKPQSKAAWVVKLVKAPSWKWWQVAGRTCNNVSECVSLVVDMNRASRLEGHEMLECGGVTRSHEARLGG